jgi:predicted CoA-binding protein
MADWSENLLEDDARIGLLVRSARRVAVLGIKPETKADQPAFYVAEYVAAHGAEVIPVPVFFPELTEILGKKVYRRVADVPGPIDIVDVFRKPSDIDAHVDDIITKAPKAAWFQLGIRNEAAAERLARAGILVVQDRCLKVEWARYR